MIVLLALGALVLIVAAAGALDDDGDRTSGLLGVLLFLLCLIGIVRAQQREDDEF